MANLTSSAIMIADGTYHDVYDLKAKTFTLENIAIALGNTCRWGGHLGGVVNTHTHGARVTPSRSAPSRVLRSNFYSVAEHCVLGAKYHLKRGERDKAKLFLLHDAGEPYIGGDIATPLKLELPLVLNWEEAIQKIIKDAYTLEGDFSDIKDTDRRICRNECIGLYGDKAHWAKEIEPLYYEDNWDKTLIRVQKWSAEQAMNEWYALAHKLELKNKYV